MEGSGRGGVGGSGGSLSKRSSAPLGGPMGRKKVLEIDSLDGERRSSVSRLPLIHGGERSVKRLQLSKALTISENTSVLEACRRMAARQVDAVLLTDSNALLSGILTDKDIVTKVIANELKLEEVPASKIMTRNPSFVLSDTLAVEALQKMVKGKFRHLPVVENGEVIALLDIAKCLYDAIVRMERAAEKGKAIAAAVEGVEKHWGTSVSGPNAFIETLRERIFKPSLSSIIPENSSRVLAKVSPSDSVLIASKRMLELKKSSAVVVIEDKPQGILTSRDILMRVIAKNLPPESTPVDKVMTSNPACGKIDTPIVNALHTMHEGKFLHLPIVNRDGFVISVVDVIDVTHAAVASAGGSDGLGMETTNSLMQKFWDSIMFLGSSEDEDGNYSPNSMKYASDLTDAARSISYYPSSNHSTFAFKLQDRKGRMHRFNCDATSLTELMASILQRTDDGIDRNNLPLILYEDEDRDKVIIASDNDLRAAVDHARQLEWKGLRLHLEFPGTGRKHRRSGGRELVQRDAWASSAYSVVAAGAALVTGFGLMAYLKRSGV